MDRVVPYCPICRTSFLVADCYRLMCNHLYCYDCLWKMSTQDGGCFCYFHQSVSANWIHMSGLKEQLAGLISKTIGLTPAAIENIFKQYNLTFVKENIPCKFKNCVNCPYDHTGKFYKKNECPWGNECRHEDCIFIHAPASQPATLPYDSPEVWESGANAVTVEIKTRCFTCMYDSSSQTQCTYCRTNFEPCYNCGQMGNEAGYLTCKNCLVTKGTIWVCPVTGESHYQQYCQNCYYLH